MDAKLQFATMEFKSYKTVENILEKSKFIKIKGKNVPVKSAIEKPKIQPVHYHKLKTTLVVEEDYAIPA